MAKMVAANVAWCRHFGTDGKGKDQERRAVKRSEKNKAKKDLRNGRDV
jgi:hypothetical protein